MKRKEGPGNGCGPKMAGYTLVVRHSVCPPLYGRNVHDGGSIQTIDAMKGMLAEIGPEIKADWQIFPVDSRGIPYLGYRIFSDHILLKKRTKKRMQTSARRIEEKLRETDYVPDRHDLGVVHSYEGVLKWCNGKNLRRRTFSSIYELNERNLALREMKL